MNVSDSIQVPSGVLLIDKARDMTSHDVVAIARRSLGIKKIGHCGTLDPMATGLLMLVVGKATKLQDKLMCEHKEYAGTLMLGVETSSQDAMGEIVAEYSVDGVTERSGSCAGTAACGSVWPRNFTRGHSGSGFYRSVFQRFLCAVLCL